MSHTFYIGYDLKGDKVHHAVELILDNFDPAEAHREVMEQLKNQRIVRALVLIDCIELSKDNPAPTPTEPRLA